MRSNQYRLLWSSISTSKKIRDIQGGKWFRVGCHLVYTWLLPWGDDDGRLRGDPLWVMANILPNENLNIDEIKKILLELHRVNLIQWYGVDGERFVQIQDWQEHQRIRKDRYNCSLFPCQPLDNQMSTTCPQDDTLSLSGSGSLSLSGSRAAKPFAPPKIDEVVKYFQENGYREDSAKKAFEYYSIANWKDSKGNQVKNWKQKMIAVWFKDENRQGAIIKHLNKAEQRDQSTKEMLMEFAIGEN